METSSSIVRDFWISMRPYPGRMNHVLRTLVASSIVVIISQSLQIPLLALSLITVFFVTQTNYVITRLTGMLFIVGTTLSVLLSLLVLNVTWNTPFLRILISFTIFFISVFLMRTTKIGAVFFIIAIVSIYTQSLVDIAPDAEILVRGILWVWIAVNYPIAVTLIINSLLMPVKPERQLKQATEKLLDDIIVLLSPASVFLRNENSLSHAGRDIQTLYRLLRYKTMRDKDSEGKNIHDLEIISFISELRTASCHLPEKLDGEDILLDVEILCDALKMLKETISNNKHNWHPTPIELQSSEPALHVMAGIISTYNNRVADVDNVLKSSPPVKEIKKRFLVKDSFSNSDYVFFSLKTLMSAAVCYVFYSVTDWSGIHTIMLSCLIVAQPGLGNIQRKITLRLVGAAIGSVFAMITILYLTPRVNTIFGLLCIVLPVLALSSWISAGMENVSYAGVQIMFTFALATLETFGPVAELTEVRDRIAGIIMGILVAGLIHTLIRPEREGGVMLKNLGKLFDEASGWLYCASRNHEARPKVAMGLAECENIAARVAIEPGCFIAEGAHDQMHQQALSILNAIKNVIYYIDRLYLERTILERKDQAEQIIMELKGNMEIISSILNGHNLENSDIHYPTVNSNLPASFKNAAKGLEESMRHFFSLISFLKVS
ncbi:FUSC family protein [Enterobacter roggenkampii]|uniref:FUSC family protein n=1 Tax=Enterobacter roggenkampii TaxID=1812935 RepID=UPI002DB9F9BE|nr:FUSC family protein [Enterobacter roggenkampii]MEB6622844.1 FUSC family protein [Enterobacter roggenkampii]